MSDPVRLHPILAPAMARSPLIDGDMPLAEACRTVLFEGLTHLSANVEPVVQIRHAEALHQMRVALRRLRVALATFGETTPALADLGRRAKAFTTALGPARDLDVFREDLLAPVQKQLEPQPGFEVLHLRLDRARERVWDSAVMQVTGREFKTFQDDVAAAAEASIAPAGVVAIPLSDLVPGLMAPHRKRANKRGKALQQMNEHDCHHLRIALKKLRYAAEFFAPLYKEKPIKRYLEPLKDLQGLLGHLNDVAQVRKVLGRLMIDEATNAQDLADLHLAAGLIQGWHQARASRVTKKTKKRWEKFQDAKPFWL